jgi:hypothetical protein
MKALIYIILSLLITGYVFNNSIIIAEKDSYYIVKGYMLYSYGIIDSKNSIFGYIIKPPFTPYEKWDVYNKHEIKKFKFMLKDGRLIQSNPTITYKIKNKDVVEKFRIVEDLRSSIYTKIGINTIMELSTKDSEFIENADFTNLESIIKKELKDIDVDLIEIDFNFQLSKVLNK